MLLPLVLNILLERALLFWPVVEKFDSQDPRESASTEKSQEENFDWLLEAGVDWNLLILKYLQ